MKKRITWLAVSCLMVAALLLVACTPAAAPLTTEATTVTGQTTQTTTTATSTPTTATAATTPTTTSQAPPAKIVPVPRSKFLSKLGGSEGGPTTAVGEPTYGGQINVVQTKDWTIWDPIRYAAGEGAEYFASGIFEKMSIGNWGVDRSRYNFPTGGQTPMAFLIPLLVTWEWPDPLTAILTVNDGVRWQNIPPVNGRAFTADDIIWNIERYRVAEFVDRLYFDKIESLTKIDAKTVKVTFNPPAQIDIQAGFLDGETNHFIPPETVDSATNQIGDWKLVIGTGPWIVDDFVPGSSVTYVRNPDYWREDERHPGNKLPYADRLHALIILDLQTRLTAFRVGRIDYLGAKSTDSASILNSNPDTLRTGIPGGANPFRIRADLEPFTDVRVRRALQMALDLPAIRDSYYNGEALTYTPLLSVAHADVYTPYEDLPADIKAIYTYNPAGAKALLAEAGFPNGFDTNIVVQTGHQERAEILQGYLAEIGVNAELKVYEWPTFNSVRMGKQHTGIITYWNWTDATPLRALAIQADPTHIFNLGAWSNEEFKALTARVAVEFDLVEQAALAREAEYLWLREVAQITMPQPVTYNMWQPWLMGYTGEGSPGTYQYHQLPARLWVDQALKAEY